MKEIIDAIATLASDQGIANVISLALIWIIWNMQRAASKETEQQNKLITQHGLSIAKISQHSDKIGSLENVFEAQAKQQEINNIEKRRILETGIATIAEHTSTIDTNTGSVDAMNGKLGDLEKAVNDMSTEVKTLSANMAMVLEFLNELKAEAETPTEETTPVIDPGEPSIGKLKMVGKPYIGDVTTSSATYPAAAGTETKTEKGTSES